MDKIIKITDTKKNIYNIYVYICKIHTICIHCMIIHSVLYTCTHLCVCVLVK